MAPSELEKVDHPMWYILAVVGIAVVFVVARYVRTLWRGNRMIKSVLSDKAVPGSPESLFVKWVNDNPNRKVQKDTFMQLMMGLGMSDGWCADCVMRCIVHSWTPDGKPFGRLLVDEIDRHMTWDDPSGDTDKTKVQQRAKEMLSQMKAHLLALDG